MSCPPGDSFIADISGGFDPERYVEKFLMKFWEIRETQGLVRHWIAAPCRQEMPECFMAGRRGRNNFRWIRRRHWRRCPTVRGCNLQGAGSARGRERRG